MCVRVCVWPRGSLGVFRVSLGIQHGRVARFAYNYTNYKKTHELLFSRASLPPHSLTLASLCLAEHTPLSAPHPDLLKLFQYDCRLLEGSPVSV
jgi:hypothetical protein